MSEGTRSDYGAQPRTQTSAQLLRDTFEIAVNDPEFGARFYERLFQAHPETKALFTRHSPGAQHKMFAQKLAAIVDAVVEPKVLAQEAAAVRRTHGGYGVKPEMYDWVGEALIATLRESVGQHWSADAERAWNEAYATIKHLILTPG
jgi:hemoglobin-like flavoprotein